MSDAGSDFTEQTGMVSEFTLEREVRRERAAAAAAPPGDAIPADPTAAVASSAGGPGGVTHSHSYRSGVEESKIPEEPDAADGQEGVLGEEEDLVGDDDDEISSSVISQKQQQQQGSASTCAAGTGAHKSAVDASASSRAEESSTSASSSTGRTAPQREKLQAAVGKARQASSRAVQSVIQYEREHAIVEKAWAGVQQGVRYAGRKVRECTSVDTTTPN